jgi:hypothetical protein
MPPRGCGTRSRKICGIECEIRAERVRRAIGRVLRAIRRRPRDWSRVRRRLRGFVYFERRQEEPGTPGEWVHDPEEARRLGPQTERPETWGRVEGNWQASGCIRLSRAITRLRQGDLVAIIAHECGHVATRAREFDRREKYGDGEWAAELCADFYAARWGFERELRLWAPRRNVAHHAGLPGAVLIEGVGAEERRYRVDRHFYPRSLK